MSHTNLCINAGETTTFEFTPREPPDPDTPDTPGDPIDLSTCNRFEFVAKRNVADDEYVFRRTLENGVEIVPADEENPVRVRVTIQSSDTIDLEDGAYPYDAQFVVETGRFRALRGDLVVDAAVNRT